MRKCKQLFYLLSSSFTPKPVVLLQKLTMFIATNVTRTKVTFSVQPVYACLWIGNNASNVFNLWINCVLHKKHIGFPLFSSFRARITYELSLCLLTVQKNISNINWRLKKCFMKRFPVFQRYEHYSVLNIFSYYRCVDIL